jgi:CheY-like chemotaxis protein
MNQPLRVMIVDDEPLLRDYARDILEEAGYVAEVAANADEALAKLRAGDFSMVLTDIYMPGGLNGVEFAQRVASQFPSTRVVLMTGRQLPSLDDVPDGTLLMLKPFAGENLLSLLSFSAVTPM